MYYIMTMLVNNGNNQMKTFTYTCFVHKSLLKGENTTGHHKLAKLPTHSVKGLMKVQSEPEQDPRSQVCSVSRGRDGAEMEINST
jgi:hypothetical protein